MHRIAPTIKVEVRPQVRQRRICAHCECTAIAVPRVILAMLETHVNAAGKLRYQRFYSRILEKENSFRNLRCPLCTNVALIFVNFTYEAVLKVFRLCRAHSYFIATAEHVHSRWFD